MKMNAKVYSLEEIRHVIQNIADQYDLKAVYLFGSYARGSAGADSDIDLLVDTKGSSIRTLFQLGALYDDLTNCFDCPVDLVTVDAIMQQHHMVSEDDFRDRIWREKVCLHEVA